MTTESAAPAGVAVDAVVRLRPWRDAEDRPKTTTGKKVQVETKFGEQLNAELQPEYGGFARRVYQNVLIRIDGVTRWRYVAA